MTAKSRASVAGVVHLLPPKSLTASASSPGSRSATTSPRRWEQRTPAAAMKVARPMSAAQRDTHVERSRAKDSLAEVRAA